MTYPHTQLFINGQWCDAAAGESLAVFNPATGKEIGRVAHARIPDLDRALQAAQKGFQTWRDMLPVERNKIMRKAAALMRERAGDIAAMLTQEQGKPLAEAKGEAMAAADIIEWFADEGMRVYGRIVPSRFNLSARQMVIKDPVGPVAPCRPSADGGRIRPSRNGAQVCTYSVCSSVSGTHGHNAAREDCCHRSASSSSAASPPPALRSASQQPAAIELRPMPARQCR